MSVINGETLTYGMLRDQAAQVAGMLARFGAGPGDRIVVLLPNSIDVVRAWAGVGRLGAVAVMLNTELTGAFLAYPLSNCEPRIAIVHADLLAEVEALRGEIPSLERIIVAGPGELGRHTAFDDWRTADPIELPFPAASDIACIMYTSGTTGPPKGVMMPHAHCFLFGLGVIDNLGVDEHDHYYITLPLFHANGLLMQLGGTLIAGGRATIRERFSASAWLADVRACGATITHSLGAISAFILAQPPGSHDRDHSLRLLLSAPNTPEHEAVWRGRFGIPDVLGGYGMTEVNIPLYGERGRAMPGACGRVYEPYFQVEVRDPETDQQIAAGEVGEIMVRPNVAGGFMAGYFNMPEKTVEAWRNLWFHTGDAGRMTADGYIVFVDRIKDCIRRRGENISATAIETSFADLPGLFEVAAFAVASDIDGGEDEIMLALVQKNDAAIDPRAVAAHAMAKIPRFARPRYLAFHTSLPKTVTAKVRKDLLKTLGVTSDTIDLESYYR